MLLSFGLISRSISSESIIRETSGLGPRLDAFDSGAVVDFLRFGVDDLVCRSLISLAAVFVTRLPVLAVVTASSTAAFGTPGAASNF